MNRIDQINNEIAALEAQIEALKAEREELATAEPVVEYTATDKKRVTVNGEVVAERGGKATQARVKVVSYMRIDAERNANGTMKRDENGRIVTFETGEIGYDVTFSNMDEMKLRNKKDDLLPEVNRLWTKVIELSA